MGGRRGAMQEAFWTCPPELELGVRDGWRERTSHLSDTTDWNSAPGLCDMGQGAKNPKQPAPPRKTGHPTL